MTPPGVDDRYVERALRARPDLAPLVERAVAACEGSPRVALEALAVADPEAYAALALVVSAAHLMHPKVRRRIGFTAHAPAPIYADEADIDLEGGLLDPVVARGALP
jgi:hypothetical protein